MSDEKNVGAKSLRFMGLKVSELPFAYQEGVKQLIPDFLEDQRRLKVDRITSRFVRGSVPYFESRILECESNIRRFAGLKKDAMADIGRYMDLMKNRSGDLTQTEVDTMTSEIVQEWIERYKDDTDLVRNGKHPIAGTFAFHQLMALLNPINERLRLYEDEALWAQVGQFQESRDRFEEAAKTETESIFQLRGAIMQCHERDRLIRQAMSEPLSVE